MNDVLLSSRLKDEKLNVFITVKMLTKKMLTKANIPIEYLPVESQQ